MNSSVPGQRGGRKTKQIEPNQFDCLDARSSQLTRTASDEQQEFINQCIKVGIINAPPMSDGPQLVLFLDNIKKL